MPATKPQTDAPNPLPQQEITITDLLVKIGSLTVELDIARQQIAQLQAGANGGA